MADPAEGKIVAIFNTNPEVLDLVREALQDAGHATVVAHVDDLKRGRIDMVEFVEQHHPDVIVYDVAELLCKPYDLEQIVQSVNRALATQIAPAKTA